MNIAQDSSVLKALNWSNVKLDGRCELFHHINGLLSKSAEVGNETAEYLLSKAVLLGSKPLWSRMLRNDTLQASINDLKGYTPAAKKDVTRMFKEEAIRQLACISNVFDGNRHHARLVRLFLSRCSSDDIFLMRDYLDRYIQYFAGFEKVVYSGISYSISRMCAYRRKAYMEGDARCISEEIMGESGSSEAIPILSLLMVTSQEKLFESLRQRVIFDFDRLFPRVPYLIILSE